MYSDRDKLYLQTRDMPRLKEKINRAIELSKELEQTLSDLECYKLEFEITEREETEIISSQ